MAARLAFAGAAAAAIEQSPNGEPNEKSARALTASIPHSEFRIPN
jgi:hypothetical protein